MTRWLLVAAVTAGAVSCGGGSEAPDPAASVVTIAATGCRPTSNVALGVVVGDELVATVAHAVAGEAEIVVRHGDTDRTGVVLAVDTTLDVAVLRVDGLDAEAPDRRAYRNGEPAAMLTAGDGAVRAERIDVSGRATIRTSDIYREGEYVRPALDLVAEVSGGDSGAPVVGEDGDLLGLVWATSRRTADRAWALPIEAVEPLIDESRSSAPALPVPCTR